MSDLYSAMRAVFERRADAVLLEAGGMALTGHGLLLQVERYAALLASLGVAPGDRIAVQSEKSLAQALLYLATLRVGAVYVPLNTAYRPEEIGYFLGDAEPALFVCDPVAEDAMRGVAAAAGTKLLTQGASGAGSLTEMLAASHPPAAACTRAATDLAAIVYTSGTTGRSKGAMLSHLNLLANAEALVATWQVREADILLHALPLYHIHGLFVALNTVLLAGGRVRLLAAFDVRAVIEALPTATLFMGVPTYYTRLLASAALTHEATRSIRLFICGSAPLLPQTFHAFEAATGQRVLERYGMSECGIICSNPVAGERVPGAVGRPLPGVELRIADEAGRPVAAGEAGVIEVRGPHVFSGYWRLPQRTAAEFRDDGYFITGDVARKDADGYIHIVGRAKDMIISGGLNVYPKEIELVLDALPGVGESAVIGLPHPDFGEAVVAVVSSAGIGTAPEPAALIAAAREHLAAFKVPKNVFVVEELPRNAMGKVQKAELRRRYAATFATP